MDIFIRGLKGDLPGLLAMKESSDLPKGLRLGLKLENHDFRASKADNRKFLSVPNRNQPIFYSELAHIPPPPWPQQITRQFQKHNNLRIALLSKSGSRSQIQSHTSYTPPKPFIPKPQPRPEPIEIDQSMRFRNIKHMNRPANNRLHIKQPSPPYQEVRKQSRNFHLKLGSNNDSNIQETVELTIILIR